MSTCLRGFDVISHLDFCHLDQKRFLCSQSGEKKKDDETVDSLGEECWDLQITKWRSSGKFLKHICVYLRIMCHPRSSGERSGAQ